MKIFVIPRTKILRLYVSVRNEIKATYVPPKMTIIKGDRNIPFQVA